VESRDIPAPDVYQYPWDGWLMNILVCTVIRSLAAITGKTVAFRPVLQGRRSGRLGKVLYAFWQNGRQRSCWDLSSRCSAKTFGNAGFSTSTGQRMGFRTWSPCPTLKGLFIADLILEDIYRYSQNGRDRN